MPPPGGVLAERGSPEDWMIYLILAGRGWGKTRTGAEWLMDQAVRPEHAGCEWAVVAPKFAGARDVCCEGPAGLRSVALEGEIVNYNRTLGQLKLRNGGKIHLVGATDPDRLRGLNLAGAWADEFAAWDYEDTWIEGLVPAVRDLRGPCRIMVTTTPKPKRLLRELLARTDGSVRVVRGSTFDNRANLSAAALAELKARYDGTRAGRQELYGELLEDVPGALWTLERLRRVDEAPQLDRVVVGVDPAVSTTERSDETGIVVVGIAGRGSEAKFYVLDDGSGTFSPQGWAMRVANVFGVWSGDRVVAERNNGGDLVAATLRQAAPDLPVRTVYASRGKAIRAEPVAALYEQGRVFHVGDPARLRVLEDEMCSWDASDPKSPSPDRVDALVWAVTDLMSFGKPSGVKMRRMSVAGAGRARRGAAVDWARL